MKKIYATALFSFALISLSASCGRVSKPSALDAIYTDDGSGQGFVEVVGYENDAETGKRYFVSAGQNLHVVYDCASDGELFTLLDTSSDKKLDEKSLDALLGDTNTNYAQRADLSCKGSFLPRTAGTHEELDRTLYFDSDKYYFTSGGDHEYYSVSASNAACVYDFAARSFGFEQRADVILYNKPENASKTINLSCKDNTKSRYDLFQFTPGTGVSVPFKQVLILSYEDKTADGTVINTLLPIYRIDGASFDGNSASRTKLIDSLKATFKVGDPKNFSLQSLFKLGGRLFYDVCQDSCTNFAPVHQIMAVSPRLEMKTMPAAKALALPDLKGQQIIQWQVDSKNSLQFVGCEQELLPRIGIKGSENQWFPALRQQVLGQLKVSGPVFQCPKVAQPNRCEKVLDRAYYTSADFTRLLEDASTCAGATQLKVRIDSDVVVEGTEPIRLASNVPFAGITFEPLVTSDRRSLTYRYLCASKSACQPSAASGEVRAVAVSNAKNLDFRNVDFKAQINSQNFLTDSESSTLRFTAVEASNAAKVSLLNSQVLASDYKGRNLWSTGLRALNPIIDEDGVIKDRSRINCQNCAIEADTTAIDSSDSLVLINGFDRTKVLSSKTGAPLSLKGLSEAVVVKTRLIGDSLIAMGSKAKAFGHSLDLRLTGDTSTHTVSAFKFLTQRFTEAFTIDLQASDIHGLPVQQVSAFRLADFAQTDGTATLNLSGIQFFRGAKDTEILLPSEQLDFFLKCEGRGRLLYRFKNYCP